MTALECDASGFLRLCDVSRLTERELPLAMRRIGSRARDNAHEHEYVNRTSRLTNSIAFMSGRDGNTFWAQIGTNVEYAPYVEFGTGQKGSASYTDRNGDTHVTEGLMFKPDWKGNKPYPYLRPALYNHKATYIAMINDAVKRSIKQGGGSA